MLNLHFKERKLLEDSCSVIVILSL